MPNINLCSFLHTGELQRPGYVQLCVLAVLSQTPVGAHRGLGLFERIRPTQVVARTDTVSYRHLHAGPGTIHSSSHGRRRG